jgi:hypothetical protein
MKLFEAYRSPVLHGYVIEVENLAEFPVLLRIRRSTLPAWSPFPQATNICNLVRKKPAKQFKRNSELAFTSSLCQRRANIKE